MSAHLYEAIIGLRLDRPTVLDQLARMIARWAIDHAVAISIADPEMPPRIVNRAADNWRPLLAVGDVIGGAWPQRAPEAALNLIGSGVDDQSRLNLGVR